MMKNRVERIEKVYMGLLLVAIVTLSTLLIIPFSKRVGESISLSGGSYEPVQILEGAEGSAENYTSTVKPKISFGEYKFGPASSEAIVPIFSDKELDTQANENLKLIEKSRFYTYEFQVTGSTNGTSYQTIVLSDKDSNTISEKLVVVNSPNTTNSIPDFPNTTIVPNGNDLMAVVDKGHKLSPAFVPSDLVYLPDYGIPTTTGGWLRRVAIKDVKAMTDAMEAQGLDIKISSAYRSYNTQISTYNMWVGYNGGKFTEADRISARPGYSEHQLGTTVDFINSETNYKLTTAFGATRSGRWLAQNSYKFGFALSYPEGKESTTGYSYEPWHFRYIGKDNALKWRESGLTLNEFLKRHENSN